MTRNGRRQLSAAVGHQEQHHDRRGDRAQRRPALEDAVAQRPVAASEQALRRHECTGPVAGLEKPEQHPADEQLVVAVTQPVANPTVDQPTSTAG